ncbi:tripartite tricarboxylate transporter TctB family protein, partial [Duodenibacillus massiliensis]
FKGFLPKQFIGVIIGIIVYVVLLVTAGYYIATIAYLAGALLFLKVKKQWIVLVIAVLLAVIYPVFTLFLKVPLPKGMLFS